MDAAWSEITSRLAAPTADAIRAQLRRIQPNGRLGLGSEDSLAGNIQDILQASDSTSAEPVQDEAVPLSVGDVSTAVVPGLDIAVVVNSAGSVVSQRVSSSDSLSKASILVEFPAFGDVEPQSTDSPPTRYLLSSSGVPCPAADADPNSRAVMIKAADDGSKTGKPKPAVYGPAPLWPPLPADRGLLVAVAMTTEAPSFDGVEVYQRQGPQMILSDAAKASQAAAKAEAAAPTKGKGNGKGKDASAEGADGSGTARAAPAALSPEDSRRSVPALHFKESATDGEGFHTIVRWYHVPSELLRQYSSLDVGSTSGLAEGSAESMMGHGHSEADGDAPASLLAARIGGLLGAGAFAEGGTSAFEQGDVGRVRLLAEALIESPTERLFQSGDGRYTGVVLVDGSVRVYRMCPSVVCPPMPPRPKPEHDAPAAIAEGDEEANSDDDDDSDAWASPQANETAEADGVESGEQYTPRFPRPIVLAPALTIDSIPSRSIGSSEHSLAFDATQAVRALRQAVAVNAEGVDTPPEHDQDDDEAMVSGTAAIRTTTHGLPIPDLYFVAPSTELAVHDDDEEHAAMGGGDESVSDAGSMRSRTSSKGGSRAGSVGGRSRRSSVKGGSGSRRASTRKGGAGDVAFRPGQADADTDAQKGDQAANSAPPRFVGQPGRPLPVPGQYGDAVTSSLLVAWPGHTQLRTWALPVDQLIPPVNSAEYGRTVDDVLVADSSEGPAEAAAAMRRVRTATEDPQRAINPSHAAVLSVPAPLSSIFVSVRGHTSISLPPSPHFPVVPH